MRSRKRLTLVAVGAVLAAVAGGVAVAAAALPFSQDGTTINGCYSPGGALKLLTPSEPTCSRNFAPIQWSATGPQGPQGTQGPQGVQGPQGPQGPAGLSGRVLVQAAANSTGAAIAECPQGKVVLGGGYNGGVAADATFNGPAEVIAGGVQGWLVISDPGEVFTAFAICVTG